MFSPSFRFSGLIIGIVGIILSVNIRKELQAIGDNVETIPVKGSQEHVHTTLSAPLSVRQLQESAFVCGLYCRTIGIAACSSNVK